MGRESNLHCKCGGELFATDCLTHVYYICKICNKVHAIKGTEHFFHCPEIDLKTGKIYPYQKKLKGEK